MELFVDLSEKLGRCALKNKAVIVTAESCTAGGIACSITQTAGSSEWFDRGFVTYTNESKKDLLGVADETLQTLLWRSLVLLVPEAQCPVNLSGQFTWLGAAKDRNPKLKDIILRASAMLCGKKQFVQHLKACIK